MQAAEHARQAAYPMSLYLEDVGQLGEVLAETLKLNKMDLRFVLSELKRIDPALGEAATASTTTSVPTASTGSASTTPPPYPGVQQADEVQHHYRFST